MASHTCSLLRVLTHVHSECSSFGYLNQQGFCNDTACHRFPVIIGELASGLGTMEDIGYMESIATYLHNTGQHYSPMCDSWHSQWGLV